MKSSANKYYVYAYRRLSDNTPYYIGKGTGNRAYQKTNRSVSVPKNKTKITFLQTNLFEEDAFTLETKYIKLFGRKDLESGILLNKTDGGEGVSGSKRKFNKPRSHKGKPGKKLGPMSEEQKKKISEALKNKPKTEKTKELIKKSKLGVVLTEETKNKIKISLIGNKRALKTKII
jgi:hypothetical protein